jgi:hypothetical protein
MPRRSAPANAMMPRMRLTGRAAERSKIAAAVARACTLPHPPLRTRAGLAPTAPSRPVGGVPADFVVSSAEFFSHCPASGVLTSVMHDALLQSQKSRVFRSKRVECSNRATSRELLRPYRFAAVISAECPLGRHTLFVKDFHSLDK